MHLRCGQCRGLVRGQAARVLGVGRVIAGVVVVEAPAEWSGGVVVTVLERAQPFGEDVEVGEVIGREQLALDDGQVVLAGYSGGRGLGPARVRYAAAFRAMTP